METVTPLIVEIARYRREDGPGIRTVVFFKGCELRCSFCQNPEAQDRSSELAARASRCIRCAVCAASCPRAAVGPDLPGLVERSACTLCGACADACPTGALLQVGRYYAPAELAEILLRDRAFYQQSGGGVTLSGGEPGLFGEYLSELLPILKAQGVHVLLETGGHFPDYSLLQTGVLPHINAIDFSLKIIDPVAHAAMAGQDNRLILENLRRLVQEPRVSLAVSIPIVPGVTDSEDNLRGLLAILTKVGIRKLRLLPYNPVGVEQLRRRGHAIDVEQATLRGQLKEKLPRTFMTAGELSRVAELVERIAEELGSAISRDGR